MKPFKMIASVVGVLVGLGLVVNGYAGERVAITDHLDMELLWRKSYDHTIGDFGHLMSNDGKVCIIIPGGIKGKWNTWIEVMNKTGKIIWSKSIPEHGYYTNFSEDGRYLMIGWLSGEDYKAFSYFDETGKELWKKFLKGIPKVSPNGEFIGYSGIFSPAAFPYDFLGWDLMDKNAKLLWSYQPKYCFSAIILNNGSTVMVEGKTIRHYDRTGKKVKDILILEMTPLPLGAALEHSGPLYLVTTSDGRYVAFVRLALDPVRWMLYSVDMETGKWWSRIVDKGELDFPFARNLILTSDGRYLILHHLRGIQFFDNVSGKLLWEKMPQPRKDVTLGYLQVSEKYGFILADWSIRVSEESNRRFIYKMEFLDFRGKTVWDGDKAEGFLRGIGYILKQNSDYVILRTGMDDIGFARFVRK